MSTQIKTDIQDRLAELGDSPQDNGTIEMIVSRPESNERVVLEQAEFSVTEGLIGDNWQVRGSRHTEDGSPVPGTEITIMNSRTIDAIAQDREKWALAGDQLFVDLDLSAENLPVGQRLAVGTAILEVSEVPHNGCGKFTERFGSEATRLVNSKEGRAHRRRGINLSVVQAGTVKLGDTVSKI